MNYLEKMEIGICADPTCGRPLYDENRKFCWHCTNFKRRFGMTHTGVMAERLRNGKVCFLCQKTKIVLYEYGVNKHPICPRCFKICDNSKSQGWLERLASCVVLNSCRDECVKTPNLTQSS